MEKGHWSGFAEVGRGGGREAYLSRRRWWEGEEKERERERKGHEIEVGSR